MSALLGKRRLVAAIILVLVAVVAGESVVLAATVVRQGPVEYMKVATETALAQTSSTGWSDVSGTALAIQVPGGENDFLQIEFTADESCTHTAGPTYAACEVKALVDGQVVQPGALSVGHSQNLTSAPIAVQWASPVLGPGTHYVKIQFTVLALNNQHSLGQRTMTVIRARAS